MKSKKLIAFITAIAILVSSLALASSAFATTHRNISTDTIYIDTIYDEDMVWYTYTPTVSGVYAFVSFTRSTEAYLFTKEISSDSTMKEYNQIAFAVSADSNYQNHENLAINARNTTISGNKFTINGTTYEHYASSFYLEHYLVSGVKYYFAAGLRATGNGTIKAALYNVSSDTSNIKIDSISATSDAKLKSYIDGSWFTDSSGATYYQYNYSKITQNMTINVKYKDGTTKNFSGSSSTIDGYDVTYKHTQNINHWYAQESSEYVSNVLTVSVGPFSYDYEVQIENSTMYSYSGKVVDYVTGEPIVGAKVYVSNNLEAETNANGIYYFVSTAGQHNITIQTPTSIDYSKNIVIDAQNTSNNNQTKNPIRLVNFDYVKDGIINAKDYAYSLNNGELFSKTVVNFTSNKY